MIYISVVHIKKLSRVCEIFWLMNGFRLRLVRWAHPYVNASSLHWQQGFSRIAR